MCHLVSWRVIPRTDAEIARDQFEVFNNEGGKEGLHLAMERAETLVQSGAREVKVWHLVGEAKAKTVIEWSSND